MIARLGVALAAAAAIAVALWHLEASTRGLVVTHASVGETPVTIHAPRDAGAAPAVVIAHGFAGSRQLMQPFAVTLARNGYVAVSFDFAGHGRNPVPLRGDVTAEEGATQALLAELERVIAFARDLPGTDGRVALLGHSMASDIVVRAAVADPEIAATVAVSMFSRAVTPDAPRNLLVIVGAWEGFLAGHALDAVAMATGGQVREGETYGAFANGTARRAVLADNVEHVGVLYSRESMAEALAWLNAVFDRSGSGYLEVRGPWLALLFAGIVALGWPLAGLLPRCARGAGARPLSRRAVLVLGAGPAVATPLILWPLPTGFLPVLVADYLAVHFAAYGLLVGVGLWWLGALRLRWPGVRLALAALAASVFAVLAIGLPLDAYVASFMPHAGRLPVMVALAAGTLLYALSDEWLVRRPGAPWWAYGYTKLCLLLSLALAIALDLESLFFLIIILPVMLLFFLIYGTFSAWIWRATGHPSVAGVAIGIAFAWALGVTFPMIES